LGCFFSSFSTFVPKSGVGTVETLSLGEFLVFLGCSFLFYTPYASKFLLEIYFPTKRVESIILPYSISSKTSIKSSLSIVCFAPL